MMHKLQIDFDDEFEHLMLQTNPSVPQFATQYRESRRVFYAAISVVFAHMNYIAEHLDENSGVAELERMKNELREFNERVKGGKD